MAGSAGRWKQQETHALGSGTGSYLIGRGVEVNQGSQRPDAQRWQALQAAMQVVDEPPQYKVQ
jgi:hypothetical protein